MRKENIKTIQLKLTNILEMTLLMSNDVAKTNFDQVQSYVSKTWYIPKFKFFRQ